MTSKWIDFCYIVFYMGPSIDKKESFSRYNNRISYLKRTIHSTFVHTNRICVFVCNDYDYDIVKQHITDVECIKIDTITSMHLPCEALLYVQNNMSTLGLKETDIIYFTEADHIIFVNNSICDDIIATLKSHDVYVSMHRLEPIYKNQKGSYGDDRGNNCELYGHTFVLTNTTPHLDKQKSCVYNPLFYQSKIDGEGYSGAHIMTYKTFTKVRIINNGILEWGSHSCFYSLPCLKTLNYLGLYLIHLSTYEYHAMLAGDYNIAITPMYNGY